MIALLISDLDILDNFLRSPGGDSVTAANLRIASSFGEQQQHIVQRHVHLLVAVTIFTFSGFRFLKAVFPIFISGCVSQNLW